MAATSAASRPPSAMRLETSRSVMNRRPGERAVEAAVESSGDDAGCVAGAAALGSNVDSAFALSSAVGIRMLQPT